MKKGWKIAGILAGVAAAAALLPYSVNKDEEKDETSVYALLWKYTNKPDHLNPGHRAITVDIGFHNPLKDESDELMLDDEPLVECTPVCECTCSGDCQCEEETPCDCQWEAEAPCCE